VADFIPGHALGPAALLEAAAFPEIIIKKNRPVAYAPGGFFVLSL